MNLDLAGTAILVSGGSDGLGAAVALRLVQEGASVAICARDPVRLAATEQRLVEAGGSVLAVPADVTRRADVERFVSLTLDRFGRLDGVVNNAGASATAAFEELREEDWSADLDLKLLAAHRLIQLALPALLRSDQAAVVNVLNTYAKAPEARTMPTSVTRAAGMAMTKALSRELAGRGVRVNGVLVGFIESGQWERAAEAAGTTVGELYAELAREERIPLGRVGRAEEFADLVAFLLSARASYVTGAAINVDGGLCPVV